MRHVELSYRTGDHKPEGLFFAYGPGIEANGAVEPVRAEDFAPTFARLLGTSMPETDGHLIPLFFKSAETSRQVSHADT